MIILWHIIRKWENTKYCKQDRHTKIQKKRLLLKRPYKYVKEIDVKNLS